MDWDEITKGPVIDLNAPAKPAESQVDRVKRELEGQVDPLYLKTYVISKAEEFEKLRRAYETQLSWAKAEMKRLGIAADQQNLHAIREGYKARDREWLKFLETFPGMQVAIGQDGLIDITGTLTFFTLAISESVLKKTLDDANKV